MKAKPANDLRKEIEVRAYHIWEREGCPHGRQAEHWRQAEIEVAAEHAPKPRAKVKVAALKAKRTTKATKAKPVSGGRRKGPKSAIGKPEASE
jgi:hypothetical protein